MSKKVYNAFPLSQTITNINQALMQIFKNQYGQSVWALGRGTKTKCRRRKLKEHKKSKSLIFEEFDHGSD